MTEDKERVDAINQIANGFGQTLLTLTGGDWDLAMSVCVSLLASTVAQGAFNHGDDVGEVFDSIGGPARVTTLAVYAELVKAEEDEE